MRHRMLTKLTFVSDICEGGRIILCLHLSVSDVCVSRRSRKAIRLELNTFLFLHGWTWTLHVAAH